MKSLKTLALGVVLAAGLVCSPCTTPSNFP